MLGMSLYLGVIMTSYKFELNYKENGGILVPLEEKFNIPFDIKRIFYTYNVPMDEGRGNHAYKETKQVLICTSGSVSIKCFDGKKEKIYDLNNPLEALYIEPIVWRTTFNHSSDCVLLILSSKEFDEGDYIRDYDEFVEVTKCI